MDPEPRRCRRTNGKKWRYLRYVVAGHKYCELHMHHGRNCSRKPVELHVAAACGTANDSLVGSLNNNASTTSVARFAVAAASNDCFF